MKSALLLILCLCTARASDWQKDIHPTTPGSFAELRPFRAEYRFGWSDFEAARANVAVKYDGGSAILEGSGQTNGPVRLLWQLDATHEAWSKRPEFLTMETRQSEKYASRTVTTHLLQKPDGFWRLRDGGGPNPAKWKKIKISPIRDLFSGMLFIRSQPLKPDDEVVTVIFPGDSPFLVKVKSLGSEQITIAGTVREAIKLDLQIQKINLKNNAQLEAQGKFRSGKIWLSNDADRIPLRAEVDIFIGFVFGELASVEFGPSPPPVP